jgi:hypothetical protein
MLLVHMTVVNALELLATGVIFGFGWYAGNWAAKKLLG